MIRVGLLGCGNIGRVIAAHQQGFTVTALFDIIPEHARDIAAICGAEISVDFPSFLKADTTIVVEAASVGAVREYGEAILSSGHDLAVMSVGALADPEFREDLLAAARASGRRIYIPSGAVTGLDNLKVARIAGTTRLLLRTIKSPASLGITTNERRLLFSGKSHECIRQYPKNVNVSVAISLAAGMDTDVELYADPAVDRNIHEIVMEGEYGEILIRVTNVPSPDNPATSYLAALSILSLLQDLENPLVVGT